MPNAQSTELAGWPVDSLESALDVLQLQSGLALLGRSSRT